MTIIIPGEPVAQGRGRAFGVRREDGSLGARVFDPAKSRNWKAFAAWHMARAMNYRAPLAGPIRLSVVALFTCPRSDYRKTPVGRRWHTKRPDADNVLKAIKDAAKGVLWIDDAQVCWPDIRKLIAAQGEAPCVRITVEAVGKEAEAQLNVGVGDEMDGYDGGRGHAARSAAAAVDGLADDCDRADRGRGEGPD